MRIVKMCKFIIARLFEKEMQLTENGESFHRMGNEMVEQISEWERERKGTRETNLNSNEKRRTNRQESISIDVIVLLIAVPILREIS